jgi:hypothetical protein
LLPYTKTVAACAFSEYPWLVAFPFSVYKYYTTDFLNFLILTASEFPLAAALT